MSNKYTFDILLEAPRQFNPNIDVFVTNTDCAKSVFEIRKQDLSITFFLVKSIVVPNSNSGPNFSTIPINIFSIVSLEHLKKTKISREKISRNRTYNVLKGEETCKIQKNKLFCNLVASCHSRAQFNTKISGFFGVIQLQKIKKMNCSGPRCLQKCHFMKEKPFLNL